MTAFAALALYPLWAVSVLIGITAVRIGRRTGAGLVLLALVMAVWVGCLVLLQHAGTAPYAERILPLGMLLAGAGVHAGADVVGLARRWILWLAYGWGVLVALIGALWPGAYYEPAFAGYGPLFWPMAVVSAAGSALTVLWLIRAARASSGQMRRRRWALGVGMIGGTLGSGAAVAGQVFGLLDLKWAAPSLLVAIVLVTYAIVSGERGRPRRIMRQTLIYGLLTASLSSVGLVAYYRLVPYLVPGRGEVLAWLVIVSLVAALPLDSARTLLVETIGRRLFRDPIGVGDLADEVTRSEVRADHAERLAEIGTMAGAVAHEIRNPLGIIRAEATLLERRGADPRSVTRLRDQVARADRFITDLLRYSTPRPLDIGIVCARAAVSDVAAEIARVDGSGPIADALAIAVPDVEIEADAGAFHDVHAVLLHNAIAAVHDLDAPRVEVTGRRAGAAVEIAVQDNGPGVPREIEDRLFEPFVTGRGRDARYPGTGLGLAIAARWVARHGGTIRHERPVGGGARFVVRWPRAHG